MIHGSDCRFILHALILLCACPRGDFCAAFAVGMLSLLSPQAHGTYSSSPGHQPPSSKASFCSFSCLRGTLLHLGILLTMMLCLLQHHVTHKYNCRLLHGTWLAAAGSVQAVCD